MKVERHLVAPRPGVYRPGDCRWWPAGLALIGVSASFLMCQPAGLTYCMWEHPATASDPDLQM
eukprot:7123782-Karenia_brevis.AAC.1